MSKIRSTLGWLVAGASALALAGCGGGHSNNGSSGSSTTTSPPATTPTPTPTTAYAVTPLVSNVAGAAKTTDPDLENGWGISFAPTGAAWVSSQGANVSTVYDGDGNIKLPSVHIPSGASGAPSGPTGQVGYGGTGFVLSKNGASGSAAFMFAGTGGTISGWSPAVDKANAITMFDGSTQGDVFTGLAIVTQGTNMLIAADSAHGTVDAFADNGDGTVKPVTLAGDFTDPGLPAGYKPFGVQTIGSNIYVSYAHFTGTNPLEDHAAGLGLVDVYDLTGKFVKRLVTTGGNLNAPWGMAMAPASFGQFSNDLLVSNFGDGTISVYDPSTGNFLGQMSDANGKPIVIQGLWGIAFGNDAAGLDQPSTTLFYASGPSPTQGFYGRIDVGATSTSTSSTSSTSTSTSTSTSNPLGY